MSSPNNVSLSGLSDGEAQEFHKAYIQGMALFVAIAVVAHFLVWMWRPWIPGPNGYAALERATDTVTAFLPMIA